jgi:sugar phosphate isomerase/epimerase
MEYLNEHEIECALREEATKHGVEITSLQWEGGNPRFILAPIEGRSEEDMLEVGRAIIKAALGHVLHRATSKAIKDGFRSGFKSR